jgi:hypothetical protein
MKIQRTTSLNQAIRRLAAGDTGAASVLALILKERADQALAWMRLMDQHEIYGRDIWRCYSNCAGQDLAKFFAMLNDGSLKAIVQARRKK